MDLHFEPVRWPDDADAAANFLLADEWPFHGTPQLSADAARRVRIHDDAVDSVWVREGGVDVGLIRLLDLDDVETGSPVFDLRIASGRRGRGIGRAATEWLTAHLFERYPVLHRIEATTRVDNVAMQTVLDRAGYRLEGRFVEAWCNADGTWSDARSYAILRREHVARLRRRVRDVGR